MFMSSLLSKSKWWKGNTWMGSGVGWMKEWNPFDQYRVGAKWNAFAIPAFWGKQRKREVHFWERNTNTFWERCIRTKSTEERYTKNKSTEERCTRKKCTKERYTDTFCAIRPLLHLALLLGWSEITRGWGKVIHFYCYYLLCIID